MNENYSKIASIDCKLEESFPLQAVGCELDESSIVDLLERHQEKITPSVSEGEAAAHSQAEPETPSGISSRHRLSSNWA